MTGLGAGPMPKAERPDGAQIFLSYSRKDDHFRKEIVPQLQVLENCGVHTWTDRSTPGSARWEASIHKALDAARIVVLLVSQHSLTSKFILHKEVSEEIRKKRLVYPILIRACAWSRVDWLSEIEMRPKVENKLTPVATIAPLERDAVYAEIAEELAGLVAEQEALAAERKACVADREAMV